MNITIVGLGVIGGSYGLSLKEANLGKVWGIDVNEITLRKAESLNIIEQGFCINEDYSDIIKKSHIIVLCIYPNLVKDFIIKHKDDFTEGTIITDVTGIKSLFVNEILEILPKGVDFVFAHPMAGREKKGIDYASKEVFKGANFIITPTDKNKPESIKIIEDLAYKMGFSTVKMVSPEEHDLIISHTSQLPHALAVALINSDNLHVDTGKFIGDSYRELTRIANINGELWSELFLGNKENLLSRIEAFEEQLNLMKKYINEDNRDGLIEIFRESTLRREKL
jgi:prephenate dehydrogenase